MNPLTKILTQEQRLNRIAKKIDFEVWRDSAGIYISKDCENGKLLVCEYGGVDQSYWDYYGRTEMNCQLYTSPRDFGTNRILFSVNSGDNKVSINQEVSFVKQVEKVACHRPFNIVSSAYRF